MDFTDKRIMPDEGREVRTLVVLLHDTAPETLLALAERWRGHLPYAAFAAPDGRLSSPTGTIAWFAEPGLGGTAIEDASTRLAQYIDGLKAEYGLVSRQIVLVGLGKGTALAIHHGLKSSEAVGAVVGFSGGVHGFHDLEREVVSRPPVFLIHGEHDKFVPPAAFLQNYVRLQNAGVPANMCFRPQIDHTIDAYGADAAMFFLQGVLAATATKVEVRKAPEADAKSQDEIAKGIKLVIWDLDETLWDGTLDDVGELRLNDYRVDVVRRLNQSGIVSAICSKNEFAVARKALEDFGLWDEFVFPRISFVPKGDALQRLISDMQLKPANCLFIDDNAVNLAEARAMLPDLHTLDATSQRCDAFLRKIVDTHAHVNKSRVEEYRSLQARITESQQFDGDREGFLATCDIHVCIAWRADVADFAPRIEELINRTNQMNFLKTRVEPGKMIDYLSEPSLRQCLAVFAWDKFGYHGLVGFIGIDINTQTIQHLAFSCRVMHMGIENWLVLRALAMFPQLKSPVPLPFQPSAPSWLNEMLFSNDDVRNFILTQEKKPEVDASTAKLRIMANCQSGVWAHFTGLRDLAHIDNFPRAFLLPQVLSRAYLNDTFAPALVYEFGTDLYSDKWPANLLPLLTEGLYEQCATEFCTYLEERGHRMLVIGPPRGIPDALLAQHLGQTRERIDCFNRVWEQMAQAFDCVEVLDVEGLVGVNGIVNHCHFSVEASQQIAGEITRWFHALPQSLFEPELESLQYKVA